MSLKSASEVAAVVLTLGILANPVRAELIKLTDEQMDQVAAGAFNILGSTQNLSDAYGVVYNFNTTAMNYTATNGTWRPLVLTYYNAPMFPPNQAIGVLINDATGQTWDGGFTAPLPGPLGPCSTCMHFGPV